MIRSEAAWRALQLRHQRQTNALRREFRDRALLVLESLVDEEGGLKPSDVPAFKRGMAPLYDEFYGRYRGDESARFYVLTVTQAREAYRLAGAIHRSLVASLVDGRVQLPFDKGGRERAD